MKTTKKLAYIRRKPQQTSVPKELIDQSMQYAGAESITGTRRAITGLSQAEKMVIMPELISMSANNDDFDIEVNEFFHTLRIEVPANIGAKLNIATDGERTVQVNGQDVVVPIPVQPLHYVLYKRAMSPDYKQVANSLEEAYAQNARFYIIDESTAKADATKVSDLRDEAFGLFLKAKEDPTKLDTYLLGLNVNPDPLASIDKVDKLRELATATLATSDRQRREMFENFIKVMKDDSLQEKATLQEYINHKIITVEEGIHIYDANGKPTPIGNQTEALAWLKDSKNTKDLAVIKAKLQAKKGE